MLTRAEELSNLKSWILANSTGSEPAGDMPGGIDNHLDAAKRTAEGADESRRKQAWRAFKGSSFERSLGNLDAAEVHLLRLAPTEILTGALPSIQAHVNRFLPKADPRRMAVDEIATDKNTELDKKKRDLLIGAQHAANTQRRRDLVRLRGFRNLMLGAIVLFSMVAIGLGVVGSLAKTHIPLCFAPEAEGFVKVVCPLAEKPLGDVSAAEHDFDGDIEDTVTRNDVWLVELMGLLGAALAGAAALGTIRGTSTPYGVPITLALVKLPTGAVTAVVGLVLLRAEFIPGLSALDSSAQILAWAVVFGIAQQLVTRVADIQAAALLDNVGGRGPAGDRELKE